MGKLSAAQKLKNKRRKIHYAREKTLTTTNNQAPPTPSEEEMNDKPIRKVYLPNNSYDELGFNEMDKCNEELVYDPSSYQLYHEFDLGFPCLSFVFAPCDTNQNSIINNLPTNSTKQLLTSNFIAGSQMEKPNKNQIVIGSITNISYKNISEKLTYSSSEHSESDVNDEYDDDIQPNIKVTSFPHNGSVNKIVTSSFFSKNYIATWSELGMVNIYDISEDLAHLIETTRPRKSNNNKKPTFSFNGHTNEGYALDWSPLNTARLASGSCDSTIAVWNPTEYSWQVDCISSKQNNGHQSSVECVQWSPNEKDILASCGCDGFIRIWDIRSPETKPVMSIQGHPGTDVNVFSWNKYEPFIVSGDDNGVLRVWDLRKLSTISSQINDNSLAVCEFAHHKKAITSVEWHPTDTSTFISSGEDDQLVIWDLAVETENIEKSNIPDNIAPQIMFIHLGQDEIKECHWHPQHSGLIMSTAFKGFNIFKTISV